MKKKAHLIMLASAGLLLSTNSQASDSFTDALVGGKANLDMRLRWENVDQDGISDNANALTLRTRLGYLTGDFSGFKAFAEATNTSTLFGVDDYRVPKGPHSNSKLYPVIADPTLTRVNRVWISYSGIKNTPIKVGRQRIKLDNDRFVGNVGWRQTEQVYDALRVGNTSIKDTKLTYGYIDRVYNIFDGEVSSDSHLFNANYKGLSFGTLTGYAYLLDLNDSSASGDSKTFGIRFAGKHAINDGMSLLYELEYADQSDYADAPGSVDASYTKFEFGAKFKGVTMKAAQETLGGDGTYGFQTVLATKHAFNGWADKFLVTPADGLVDRYLTVATKVKGVKLKAVYHDFQADEGGSDYGTELDLVAAKKFGDRYTLLVKYATYDADKYSVDTDKLWIQGSFKF